MYMRSDSPANNYGGPALTRSTQKQRTQRLEEVDLDNKAVHMIENQIEEQTRHVGQTYLPRKKSRPPSQVD